MRVLAKVHWQLFGSFTFKSERLTDRVRVTMWFSLLREVANASQVSLQHLLWCRREELGEVGKRLHFHALIGGLPRKRIHLGTCFQLMRQWERVGGGHARVRVFDPNGLDAAIVYSLHGLAGDDFYESSKFNRAQLTLSESTRAVVRGLLIATDRTVGTAAKYAGAPLL